jgi:hypothetical protein
MNFDLIYQQRLQQMQTEGAVAATAPATPAH